MYIIAIAWLYVVVMIAVVSDSILKGVIRLLLLGVLPVGLWLWMLARQHRNRVEGASAGEQEGAAAPSDMSQ